MSHPQFLPIFGVEDVSNKGGRQIVKVIDKLYISTLYTTKYERNLPS